MAPPRALRPLLAAGVFAVGLGASGPAHATPGRGPRLEGRLALEARGGPLGRVAHRNASRLPVPLLVQTTEPGALVAWLRARGASVGTVAGDVVTATVARSLLPSLSGLPGVIRVEASRRLRPRVDRARSVLGVDAIHEAEPPLVAPYTGRSVLVGVVDLTLDLGHPAFLDQERTRLVALWDQDGRGPTWPGFDYGYVCLADDIDSGRCPHVAYYDHGTHVFGIAAGSRHERTRFHGIAPGADLGFVSLGGFTGERRDIASWLSGALCDAVGFLFAVAADRGQPAVVNLSVGSHVGPHDGSSLGERCLDNLVGPGRILVAAAGNEGAATRHHQAQEPLWVHAEGDAGDSPQRVSFLLGSDADLGEELQIWFEGESQDATLSVGFRTPEGEEVVAGPLLLEDDVVELDFAASGLEIGPVHVVTDRAPSGDRSFEIDLIDEDDDGLEGEVLWFFEIARTGPFDAFLDVTTGAGFVAREHSTGVVVDGRKSVGYPATAAGVIAVGSTVSKVRWRSLDGTVQELYDPETGMPHELGALSDFSSRGPTRDPAVTGAKPDCVAPGEMIVSALPAALVDDFPSSLIVTDDPGYYAASGGTSESAPAVAGVIALLLERNPSLAPDDLRALFATTSWRPSGVGTGDASWGEGLVDASAALRATPELFPGEVPAASPHGSAGCHCSLPRSGGAQGGGSWLLGGLGLLLVWRRRVAV